MSHQRNRSPKQRSEILTRRLLQNLKNWFTPSGLLVVRSLLLLDHSNGVNEKGTSDGGSRCGNDTRFGVTDEEGDAEKDAKLWDTFEADSDEAGTNAGQAGGYGMCDEDGTGF